MLKIDQFWQHVKSATFAACCTIWRQCPIADIIDLGQCHLAVAATNVVQSERVSGLRSRGVRKRKGRNNDH
jgi:hypothetical protein